MSQKRRAHAVAALLLCASAMTAPARAQTAENPADATASNAFPLGQIVVVAPAQTGLQVGSATLSQEAINTFARTSLDDALNLIPGANSGNSGGTRNERLIFVRGFNRFEVPLTIDGIRIYLPADNRLDFGRFLTTDIAEMQVAKGYVSVLNGPDGMGGAINLVTAKPTKALEADLRSTLNLGHDAEYTGYNVSALLGTKQDKWYAQASYARSFSDHWDLSDGFTPTATQASGHRALTRSADWRASAKFGFTPNATDEYTLSYIRQEGTKLAPLSTVDTLASQKFWTWPQWNTSSLYFLSTTRLDDMATLKTRIYRNTFYNTLDSFDDITESTQTKPYAFNSLYKDEAWGGSAQIDLKPSPSERLSITFQARRDKHTEQQQVFPGGLYQPVLTDIESTYSMGAENELVLAPGLTLLAGAGYDWRQLTQAQNYGPPLGQPLTAASVLYNYPTAGSASWSGQGQLTWQANPDTSLHLSVSSRARFPTIFERFSQRFGTSIPNPALQPERATNFELGGTHNWGGVKLEAAGFYSRLNDVILSEATLAYACTASTTPGPCAATVLNQSRNVGDGKTYGGEVSLEVPVTAGLTVGGNYTWTHQDITDPANPAVRPTGVPTHKAFLYADWAATSRLHVVPSAEIMSDVWTVTDVAPIVYFRTGAHENVALRVDYTVLPGITASIGARNLLDQNYQLVSGYPEPGRSFYLSLRARY